MLQPLTENRMCHRRDIGFYLECILKVLEGFKMGKDTDDFFFGVQISFTGAV